MDVLELLDLCRICLGDGASVPIFETVIGEWKDIGDKLNTVFGEQIEDIYGYPRNICEPCNQNLTDTYTFINKFKETRQVLEKALLQSVKQELVDYTDEYDDDSCSVKVESEIKSYDVKLEPTIAFNNSQRNHKLVKPLAKKKKRLENESKKVKREFTDNAKKNKNIKIKKSKKKTEQKLSNINNNVISAALLEGQFVFTAGKWSLRPQERVIKKESNEKKKENKKVDIPPSKPAKPPEQISKLCELCGETFFSPDRLSKHKESVHKNRQKVQCPICHNTYTNEYNLSKHITRVHSEKNFICSLCGSRFAFEKELRMHHKNVHIQKKLPKKQTCKICGKMLCNAKTLLIHERSAHTGERPAICGVCGTSFYHEDYLVIHMRLHTGEKPFKCPVCGQGYAQSCNMKSHIKHNHRLSQLDEATRKNVHPRYLRFMQP